MTDGNEKNDNETLLENVQKMLNDNLLPLWMKICKISNLGDVTVIVKNNLDIELPMRDISDGCRVIYALILDREESDKIRIERAEKTLLGTAFGLKVTLSSWALKQIDRWKQLNAKSKKVPMSSEEKKEHELLKKLLETILYPEDKDGGVLMHNEDYKNECNNVELLSCPFCGGKARLYTWKNTEYSEHSDHSDCYQVFCTECFVATSDESDIMEFSLSKERCIADWNRRTPAAPQWTTEPPKEIGWYMVLRGKWHGMFSVEVFLYRGRLFVKNVYGGRSLEQFLNEYTTQTLWLKLDVPPLPEGKENNNE